MVNEIGVVDNLRLENQLTGLTSLVRQLAVGQHQPSIATKVCGICTSMEHPTDMFPTLQETELDHLESVGAIGGISTGNSRIRVRNLIINMESSHFGQSRLSITDSTIPGATILTTATTKSATSRQLTIFRGLDEALSNKQPRVPTKHEL
ncbi:hypothetical protein CR513_49225, partial [Mucuna pruriens]